MSLRTLAIRRIVRTFRAGGILPVLVQTDAGPWVVKLRGAAQGVKALVAEIVVAELGRFLELPVLETAILQLDADVPTDDRNDELADLLAASRGDNVGSPFLEGATDLRADQLYRVPPEQAALVLWLDRFVENTDRSASSPNLLLHRGKVWLIDHGAALFFHHDWSQVTEQRPRDTALRDFPHVFAEHGAALAEVDRRAASRLTREVLEQALLAVPDEFLRHIDPGAPAERTRAAYVAYLHKRLKAPRPFLAE